MGLPAYDEPVDVDAIAEEFRPAIMEWMNQGYAIVINPQDNIKTGTLAAGPAGRGVLSFPIYWGITRIQPRRAALDSRQIINETTTRRVDFWLEYPKDEELPDIRPGFQVIATDGGNDPYLVNYQYNVTGAINSSMAWQRTVQTVTDLERKPDYKYAFVYGTTNVPAQITVSYRDENDDLQPYFVTETTGDNAFRFPIISSSARTYDFAFDGDTVATDITQIVTPGTDLNLGAVTLI